MKNLWFTTARKMCSKWTPWQRLVFRHIFCYRVIWTSKTTFSREAHPLRIVCTLLHSLKCTDWVTIFKHDIIGLLGFDMYRWFVSSGQHLVNRKWLSGLLVPAWQCHPTHIKRIIGMVKSGFFLTNRLAVSGWLP